MLKIYTIACRRADFIEMQLQSFHKNLQEPFEFTVFNNAIERGIEYVFITNTCSRLGVAVIDVQKDEQIIKMAAQCVFEESGRYFNANIANAYPLNWAWQNVISKQKDPVCILDSDVFLLKPVKLTDYLQQHQLCFIRQRREEIDYMWNAFVLLDLPKLPEPESLNWFCGHVFKGKETVALDVGGQTFRYLEQHPELKSFDIRFLHSYFDSNVDLLSPDYETFWMGDKEIALHYRSGSNWDHRTKEYHDQKTIWLKRKFGI